MTLNKLKGHTIVEVLEQPDGECLVLDNGTRIYSGDEGVFDIDLNPEDQKEEDERRMKERVELEVRESERRKAAYADTPSVADWRKKLE